MITVTVADIYTKMGLLDVDEHAHREHAENLNLIGTGCTQDLYYRRLGATTWMCAHAAQVVLQDRPVLIVTGNYSHGQSIAITIRDMCQKMTGVLSSTDPEKTLIHWRDEKGFQSTTKPFKGTPFYDKEWAKRLARRVQGPYAMIREIREENGKFNGYAEDDEYVLEFTSEGVERFLVEHPDVLLVKKDPVAKTVTLRGAFGIGVAPNKNSRVYDPALFRTPPEEPSLANLLG